MRVDRLAAALLIIGAGIGATAIDAHEADAIQPEHYCQLFSKVRDNLSGTFGAKVDPLTRFAGVDVICDQKAMVFRQQIDLRSGDVDKTWVAQRSRHWSKTYCNRHRAFAEAIRSGWTISTVLLLSDGQSLRIDAACHDAEA
jgi:hypothetical protein